MGSEDQSSHLRLGDSGRSIRIEIDGGEVVEQIIRPTGLLDPVIEVQPARGQVMHLLNEIRERPRWGIGRLSPPDQASGGGSGGVFTDNDVVVVGYIANWMLRAGGAALRIFAKVDAMCSSG